MYKEDRRFLCPGDGLFSPEEKHLMLDEGHAFGQKLIHEKYETIPSGMEDRE